jgi:regulator of sigma D
MKNIRISKVIIIAFLFLITSTLLIGCSNGDDLQLKESSTDEVENNVKNMEQNISEYKDQIESLQTQSEFLNEQNQYLKNVIQQILENFSDEEMLAFSRSQFKYDLKVNGESIPKSGKMAISSGNVEILLSQRSMGSDILQPEWLEKGKISGNYIDHILNFDTTNWEPTGTDGTVNTAQGYKKTNVKAGERLSFNITDELKERLNLDTNLIQIHVN